MASKNYLNALIRVHAVKLGISPPFHGDISGATFVLAEPCPRSLLLATVLLRLTRNMDRNSLLPRMPDSRDLAFRRLSNRDSARIAMLLNHTCACMADGYTYSFTPCLCRVAKKAGIRGAAPYANSHPEEWLVTFADLSFLPRCERMPPFKVDAPAGSAFRTMLCKTEVAFYLFFYIAQISIKKAIETTLVFHLAAES